MWCRSRASEYMCFFLVIVCGLGTGASAYTAMDYLWQGHYQLAVVFFLLCAGLLALAVFWTRLSKSLQSAEEAARLAEDAPLI